MHFALRCPPAPPPSTASASPTQLPPSVLQGTTYQFVCYGQGSGWSALARKLASNGTMSTCAVGSGAFAMSSTRAAMGLQLSYPYYRTGARAGAPETRPCTHTNHFRPAHGLPPTRPGASRRPNDPKNGV